MPTQRTPKTFTFKHEFELSTSLHQYGCNALAIFVLSHYLRIENIDEFATIAITEGNDDKKLDICYFNEESKRLIIAQDYFSDNWSRKSAPSNKASDLNTAIAWLFSAEINEIPIGIRPKAVEIRKALQEQKISQIELLYIHNCPESKNVHKELVTCANLLIDLLKGFGELDLSSIQISHNEFGLKTIEMLYQSSDSQIIIDEWIPVPVQKGSYLIESTPKWESILTSVQAKWIKGLYQEYQNDLFSANYRDYLGFIRSENNINYQIVQTANSEPENFWVFNNGITALTKIIQFSGKRKRIKGISIINGAQTTGALGCINEEPANNARVLIRIVKCNDNELVDSIIQYNNTQNEIKPEDRRSKDEVQRRIGENFSSYGIGYSYRRTNKRSSSLSITGKSISAPLCSFHGDPDIAYRLPTDIFKKDEIYEKVFPKTITVEHIFLVASLSKAFDNIKKDLKLKFGNNSATQTEKEMYDLVKYSSSKHFVLFLIGDVREEIMERRITDSFSWKAKEDFIGVDKGEIIRAWEMTIRTLLPLIASIMKGKGDDPYYEIPKSKVLTRDFASEFRPILKSLTVTIGKQFSEIQRRTVV